ncbi:MULTISPECIES: transcription antiterminator [unclassified Lactobacillus]|uniref:BglG family transcription antiterminator n=1 Tax=unclassified Lactobacillus TaxID=2620435 RepID=UPI000EFA9BEC|nr:MULTISPECIES: PTS sugar transporter subunit IIA [unclassified Lactobacillus]RMC24922.1 PRD domain-containing protein [Lactobacillus sp. ESL0247]RMC29077.1 PRD domain-containing protein [Lactobacillus sp. ESL0246]RMC32680.1 PRD domain-containing protein [Lactobacillus sp. ESL0245]
MQFSNSRLKSILLVLVTQNEHQYISMSALSAKFKVTTRTLRSDVKEINEQLSNYGICLKNKRGKGLFLDFDDSANLAKLKKDLKDEGLENTDSTYDSRLRDFILLILNGHNNIDEIIDTLFISDSTFDKYLNDARKQLSTYDLNLHKQGNEIKVNGSEAEIRSCIIDNLDDKRNSRYVETFTINEKLLFSDIDLFDLTTKVVHFIDSLGLELLDYNTKNIVIHIALGIIRIQQAQNIVFNRDVPKLYTKCYDATKKFLTDIFEEYNLNLTKEELDYFIYHLALNYPQIIVETEKSESINEKAIDRAIIAFLDRIKDRYVFNLLKDDQLVDSLRKHLLLLLKVYRIDGNRKNPLLNVIISTFPLAYEMTMVGAPILEKQLSLTLNEDEISFITLHVGASMERMYDNRCEKKNVALVCGSGTATAELLRARLQAEFSEYLNITGVYSYYEFQHKDLSHNDFIISTVPILNSKLPVIQIDLSNFQKDSFELYQYLVSISDENKIIMNLFDSKLIYLFNKKMTKKEVLDLMIEDQEKYHYVNAEFGKNVFKRESMYSTAIGGGIAIPHPIEYSAIQSKVSFARLESPIKWDNKNQIKYVFLLSINKDDYPHVQQLFTLLVELQSNTRFRKLIDKCKTIEETKDVLRTIIQEKHYGK